MTAFKFSRTIGVAFTASLLAAAPVIAQTSVLTPDTNIGGFSQAALSQQWWNWAASYPPGSSPITDTTGARASLGDKGSYFFLAGANTTDPIVRNVTVRSDQKLFFPLVNLVDGYTDQQIADFGLTLEGIRTETTNFFGNASGLYLKLDGIDLPLPPVAGNPPRPGNLLNFRQPTGVFDLILPSDDNLFGGPANGAPAGTYRAFSDGYWVGLAPFSQGTYELHFGGQTDRTGPFASQAFSQDITYRIAVVPESGTAAMLLAGLALVFGLSRQRRAA